MCQTTLFYMGCMRIRHHHANENNGLAFCACIITAGGTHIHFSMQSAVPNNLQ